MIVLDTDLGGALRSPTKNYSALVIDSDQVKPAEITLERFQRSPVHLNQLPESDPGDE